ncbi:S1 family peptidase [Mucilaginibacter jinjuensis]|uniref:Serine protease n=1 Tax=Mucilaginibacter jinjuensis TaxID=1176721 RepID=A0ABY7TEH6_9SPHI|nr:serine protease [Mucilaginibacter jinjuensis]WCT14711.1 serine protease [Mucilaginibacter jinjuensis]
MLVLLAFSSHSQTGIVKKNASQKIVRIISGDRYSTGFLWKKGNWIVATLHSIGDPDKVIVKYNNNAFKKAVIRKVLKSADLVLLETGENIAPYFFDNHDVPTPGIDTRLFTVGYYLDNQNYQDVDFEVGLLQANSGNTNILKDLLPPAVERSVEKLDFPSTNTQILFLKGHLLHGFSGAPVIDLNGNLLGIADGGLENGAANISWCIKKHYLNQLESSSESFPSGSSSATKILFAADYRNDDGIRISLGDFVFRKIKTSTFNELNTTAQYSNEEKTGLGAMYQYMSQFSSKINSMKFDIYSEIKSGYTILVPAGYNLQQKDGRLETTNNQYGFKMIYQISKINTENLNQSFLSNQKFLMPEFEGGSGPVWYFNPQASYAKPIFTINNRVQRMVYNSTKGPIIVQTIADKQSDATSTYFTASSAYSSYTLTLQNTDAERDIWTVFMLSSYLTTFSN